MPNGFDFNTIEGGIGRGLSRAADRLWDYGKEKRREEAKEKRYQTIRKAYRSLGQGRFDPKKIDAYAQLTAEGVTPSNEFLKEPEPKPDLTPLFDAFNVPEPLRESLAGFSPAQMLTVINSLDNKGEIINESAINRMIEAGYFSKEMGGKLIAMSRLKSITGMTATTAESIFGFGSTEKVPEWKLKTTRAATIIGNRTYSELKGQDLAELYSLGYSEAEVKEIFGVEGVSGTEYFRISNQLYDAVTNIMNPKQFGAFYRWKNGIEAKTDEERQADEVFFPHFNKNFDIKTGLPKPSYVNDAIQSKALDKYPITPKIMHYLEKTPAGWTKEMARQEYQNEPPDKRKMSAREFEIMLLWWDYYRDNGNIR